MKKIIFAILILGVTGAGVQTARAGDHEWAIAGKVLTGLAAASLISHAVQPAPACYPAGYYSYPAPAYSYNYYPAPAPMVVYVQPAPPPVVIYRAPVFVEAAPFVSFRFGFGGHRHFHRW